MIVHPVVEVVVSHSDRQDLGKTVLNSICVNMMDRLGGIINPLE